MLSFSSKLRRLREAQGCLTKIVNNNCPQMEAYAKGEREEKRLNLTLPTYVIPVHQDAPDVSAARVTVTKEISTTGMSVVLTEPLDCEEVVLGLRWEDMATFFRCELRHQSPIGAGLWQAGFLAAELVPAGDYPGLSTLEF